MPMDCLLFVVSDEMNISFGKFLPGYNYVEKKLYAEWLHDVDIHIFELHHVIPCSIQMKMPLDKILIV
jgi:hypothetical protein